MLFTIRKQKAKLGSRKAGYYNASNARSTIKMANIDQNNRL